LAESQTGAVTAIISIELSTNHYHTVAAASLPASGILKSSNSFLEGMIPFWESQTGLVKKISG
jgi:hypothetical protein